MEEQEVPGKDKITEYLENLNFKKKTFGGCDKEDVLSKFIEFAKMYSDSQKELKEQNEKITEEKDKIADQLENMIQLQTDLQNENEALQRKVEDLVEIQKSQEEKIKLVADMEFRQKLERNEILMRAEHDARLIKERAEQDVATMLEEGRQYLVNETREKKETLEKLNREINDHICDIRAVLRITGDEFLKVSSTITDLEERLNAYPPVMFIADGEEEDGKYYVEENGL